MKVTKVLHIDFYVFYYRLHLCVYIQPPIVLMQLEGDRT